jgi:hypothetical protein
MEQSTKIETLETSLKVNIWMQRSSFIGYLIAGIIAVLVHLSLVQFFELLLGVFLFTGIFLFGFVGISAHIQYYFRFERSRKVELYSDRIVIFKNGQILQQMFKNEINKIILCDKIKSYGFNLNPTYADSYYYLVVLGRNQERIILTCLLNISLKKKIATWYGQELEHKYQFFPFPANYDRNSAGTAH